MSATKELLRELLFPLAVYQRILLPLNAPRLHLKSYLRSTHNKPLQFYVGMDHVDGCARATGNPSLAALMRWLLPIMEFGENRYRNLNVSYLFTSSNRTPVALVCCCRLADV